MVQEAERGAFSWREIITQAESWAGALTAAVAARADLSELFGDGGRVLFIGCGSTHYLAQFVAPFFQAVTGRQSQGLPSSELLLQTDTLLAAGERPTVVALSRSGETSETILAMQKMRARGCKTLTISCYDATGLSATSDLTIAIPEGREQSFAQTRSFAGMLVAAQAVAALVAHDEALLADLAALPALADDLIARAQPLAQRWGEDETIQRITYLGSGWLYGLASEATVKMKEMSLSMAEPYHFMEFRHGPMSLVDHAHLVVALVSDRTRDYELAVLRDLRERGARIVVVANSAAGLEAFDDVLALGAAAPERARPVLYLPVVQLMAYYRSMGRGLNPDRPRNVVMAIKLSGTEMDA
jgi:glucosamine--fructose-6-phosphate aminotransferase (isomerizing)